MKKNINDNQKDKEGDIMLVEKRINKRKTAPNAEVIEALKKSNKKHSFMMRLLSK